MTRTTVDLPEPVHEQVKQLARLNGESMSYTLAGLVTRGMRGLIPSAELSIDPISGFPVVDLQRTFTVDEIAAMIEDE